MNVRFTAWFSERERSALAQRAHEDRTSINVVVREAVRAYLGLDEMQKSILAQAHREALIENSRALQGQAELAPSRNTHIRSVTNVTGNKER